MKRSLRYFLIMLVMALVGSMGATSMQAYDPTQNMVDPAPHPPELPNNGYGVWLLPSLDGGDMLRDANAKWTTLFLNWANVESSPGVYDWSSWDDALGKAADAGYEVIITINGNPSWAADTSCGPIRSEHLDDFATFLSTAVSRYSRAPYNVKIWSLYNEPDNSDASSFTWLGGCWGDADNPHAAPGAGGTAYAEMLKHVYPAMKSANPDIYVALGGLAYDYFTTDPDPGVFDPMFLDDILAAGGADYFDLINFHYYPWSGWRWEPVGANRYNRHIAYKARWLATEVYNATGQRKPVICTEVGETSHNSQGTPDYRRQIWAIYQNILGAQMANVYPITWFTGIDLEFSINYDGRRYGLLNLDGTPKPSYYAFQALATELKEATFVRPRDDLSPSIFEGYEFNDRGRTKTVLWMYPNNPSYPPPQPVDMPIAQSGGSLRVVTVRTLGLSDDDLDIVSESIITDGGPNDGDHQVNGSIRVQVDENIRFFEDMSMPHDTPTPVRLYLPIFFF